jgi:MoaA/NifB/PqqE/SkfB family radical SAM enzyme
LFFDTPPKQGPFQSYSSLVDVGVILITKAAFVSSVREVNPEDVFSKLLCRLPVGHDKVNTVRARNPYQFINVNVKEDTILDIPEPLFPPPPDPTAQRFIERSEILLRWLEWNIVDKRNKEFDIFSFPLTYRPEFEVDTTLFCHGTPACGRDCTYRLKHMRVFLDQDVGKYTIERAKALGFCAVLFSGGGENLEDEAYENFLQILKTAKDAGLRTNLATNGVNLSPTRIQELIHLLDSIRFSIPPTVRGSYCHLGVIAPSVCLARKLIREQYLGAKLYANFLMVPNTPMEELEADILLVSQLGVDGIRFKGQHEWKNGCFVLRPGAYYNHIRAIRAIEKKEDLALPPITISKLERMMREPAGARPFDACWYRDFNPLVLGCDSHNYACCEMKYEKAFDYGEVTPSMDNLKALTRCLKESQSVDPKYCFRGCKGYLVNIDLQKLLNEYETRGKFIFEDPQNVEVRDRVLRNLIRSVLTN